jgi:PAS domain S-box-containing protein
MTQELRKSGIEALGSIPWGTHFCHFYQTKRDFVELLTSYFKAGLENNEYCVWVISNPFNVEKVMSSLKKAVSDFDDHLARKNFEILPITEGYLKEGKFKPKQIVEGWIQRLNTALEKGYDGMRIHGNESWLEQEDWSRYQEYEKVLTSDVRNYRMIMLCTYPLSKSDASTFLDVAHVHGRVVSTRQGEREVLQEAELGQMENELKQKAKELETRVEQRTQELEKTIATLESEIAERKRIEAQLFTEKELSNEILDSIPGLVGLFDENMKFVRWNKAFEIASGYSPEEIRSLHGVESFYDNEQDKQVTRRILKEMFNKGFGSAEVSPLMKDGSPITLFFNGRRIEYEGKTCLLCIGVDISERKQVETQVIREKELSNEIIDSIPGVFMVLDENFRFVRWNKDVELLTGSHAKEIPYLQAIDDFYSDANEKKLLQGLLEEAFEKGASHAEVCLHTPEGRIAFFYFNVRQIHYEGKRCVICTAIDISNRKHAEERLRQSEILLAEAEQLAHVGSWSLDLRTETVTWSEELYQIFGVNPSQFDHTLETVIGFSHPDDKNFIEDVVTEAVKTHKPYSFHYRMLRPNGEERILHVSGAVMTDDQQNPIRLYGAVQDVTEAKKAEEAQQQSYNQIRSLTSHLQNIREEERTHVAREIHDELGQKLTVLKLDVLSLHKTLSNDRAATQKLEDIIDLLDSTMQSVRKISTQLRPTLLDDLGLAAAMEWHLEEFEKRSGITTRFHQPPDELQFDDVVKTALFRIFQEALTNVARHSEATEVKVKLAEDKDQLVLLIQDNGKGFNKQKAVSGKTLGILGMKERAASRGWQFDIQSDPGRGTTVMVKMRSTEKN